ncbi:hypothetical protein RWE15_17985 [Virgibacillus halophilus]|uniref:Uncharacterized protein n=1 Tax=Tigheibacillus halophilus TaxID=361280 RepID=A0ABU5C9K8_9BACI|nr:hypothetical protein [Virgibacillus halophilus]
MKKNVNMAFEIVNGKGDIDVANMDKLEFTINVQMNVTLMETTKELKLNTQKSMKIIEKRDTKKN